MEVKQIYEVLNDAVGETLGRTDLVKEDLSDLVTIGQAIFDAEAVDKYVKKLINRIGKVVFVNRVYKGFAPDIMMTDWEFGSIVEKIDADMPDSNENESWQLQNGQTYNQDKFYEPKGVRAKFFNGMTTYEIDFSIAEMQVKQSFTSLAQLNAFFSMLYTKIENRVKVDNDNLKMRTIGNQACATAYHDYQSGSVFTGDSKSRAINLLALYRAQGFDPDEELTAQSCMTNMEFLKFASSQIAIISKRMRIMSTVFNMEGRERFTDVDYQRIVMLDDFKTYADMYLQSDTFHEEYTKLPTSSGVPYWQGSGKTFAFEDITKMHYVVKAPVYNSVSGEYTIEDKEVTLTGVLACIFDKDALGINNYNKRVPTHVNAKGEFINNFYKVDARYFNDYAENFVVFFVA